MKKLMTMVLGLAMVAVAVQAAPTLRQLPWQTMARYGATHELVVDYTDLTGYTATNTTVVFTNTVTAPCAIEFKGMVLDAAFDSSTVTNALSMLMNAGYSSDPDKWIDDKEVALDGTEIKYSLGGDYASTIVIVSTPTMNKVTVMGTNVTASVVTNVTVASTGTITTASPLLNEQSSDVALHTSFGSCLDDYGHNILTSGRVRLFYRIFP